MRGFSQKICQTKYFSMDEQEALSLGPYLASYLGQEDLSSYSPVILCIGTDRATGDCLGPLVGEQLTDYDENFKVFGTLESPVHALNLNQTIQTIYDMYQNPYVIAIDAAVGDYSHIGYVTVSNCPIAPGKGVNKKLPAIGDISITGIVNVAGQNANLLHTTRLYTVMQLANCIASALKYSIDYLDFGAL